MDDTKGILLTYERESKNKKIKRTNYYNCYAYYIGGQCFLFQLSLMKYSLIKKSYAI